MKIIKTVSSSPTPTKFNNNKNKIKRVGNTSPQLIRVGRTLL